MKIRIPIVAAWLVIGNLFAGGQAPELPRGGTQPGPTVPTISGSASTRPMSSARIAGRIVAADTGKPLPRASVRLLAFETRVIRIAMTDFDGRYEFAGLAAGRYSVTPNKAGYVALGQNLFAEAGLIEISEGESADRTDFQMPRGSVITGRITDEFGEPLAGVIVQALRYQFRPSGQRQLIMGSSGNFFMPSGTNDLGEFRIFGLRPGSYYVSARPDTSGAIALSQGAGVTRVDTEDGLATTYYPGTANVTDAQIVRVEIMREANATFSLVPSRMARVAGTVRDSQGRPVSGARLSLRASNTGIIGMFGNSSTALAPDGSFALANVSPGEYVLDVRPAPENPQGGLLRASTEYASVPLTVGGEDIRDLEIVTKSGISVSGRVIFEGRSDVAKANLRISAASEEDARNVVGYMGPDGGRVGPDGEFQIPSVSGKVIFRTGFLPAHVMLKSVRLNGRDITNTPYDSSDSEDIVGLEVTLVDKQSRLVGYARNASGELQYSYRLVVYPAGLEAGDVGVRFQHNASPNNKGQTHIGRMPPGEYVALAVKGVQPGEEWDPELRKRIELLGKRFTLTEDETLEVEVPYVE